MRLVVPRCRQMRLHRPPRTRCAEPRHAPQLVTGLFCSLRHTPLWQMHCTTGGIPLPYGAKGREHLRLRVNCGSPRRKNFLMWVGGSARVGQGPA